MSWLILRWVLSDVLNVTTSWGMSWLILRWVLSDVLVHLLKLMNSSYLVLPSVRIFLLTLILMLFLTRFQNCLVSLLGAQEACPLMLCLTSIKPLSCHILSIVLVFWAPHQRNHLDRLEKVQRKITRTLFFKEFPNADVRPPYSNRLIDLDIVRVEDALKIQRLILGFKILNDLAPASFGSYIQHSRLVNTRLLHQASRTSSFFNSMFIWLFHFHVFGMKYRLIYILSGICLVLK